MLAIFSILILNILLPLVLSERNMALYFGDNWASSKGVDSGFMYLLGLINLFIFFIQFIVIQSNRYNINKHLYILFLSSSLIVMGGFSMWVLRERFLILSNIIAAAIILTNWDNFVQYYKYNFSKGKIMRYLNSMFIARIVLHLMLIYSAHYIHNTATKDNEEEFKIVSRSFYLPTIALFDIDSYGFSDKKYIQLFDRVFNEIE